MQFHLIVKDSGHFVPEEAPIVFNSEVLKFLDNSSANTGQANVVAAIKKAENYIRKYGKEKAIVEFKKNSTDIFMGDYNGNFYLSPLHPELIGVNQFNYKDASGFFAVQEEIEKAKSGGVILPHFTRHLLLLNYETNKEVLNETNEKIFERVQARSS